VKHKGSTTILTPPRPGTHLHNDLRNPHPRFTRVHWFTWRYLRCKVTETSNYRIAGWALLQLQTIAPRDTPCPLTHTGYLAHGIDMEELADAGGTEAFMTAWLDQEAATTRYQQIEDCWRHSDLLTLL